MSELGQKVGATFAPHDARSNQALQSFVDEQDRQRRETIEYSKPNRGTTAPPGSIPRTSIIL
jgi:hypothetical protein